MSLDLNKLANKLDEALSNETTETLNKFLKDKRMSNNMKKQTIKINGTGTINGVGVLVTHESNTSTSQICKFEPIQGYQNVGSSKTLPCVKCGKQAWEHPIITYTQS